MVLATSTHMLPPSNMSLLDGVERLDTALARDGIAAVGAFDATTGKVAEPPCGIDVLAAHADYVLVEADGSRCLPLKAHAAWEPVIPAHTSLTVLVVGASGFDLPIVEAVHRPEVFCTLTGAKLEASATPELVARAIAAEGLVDANGLVIVNQADDDRAARQARSFAAELRRSCPPPYTPDPCEPTGCSAFESRERALRTRSLAERALSSVSHECNARKALTRSGLYDFQMTPLPTCFLDALEISGDIDVDKFARFSCLGQRHLELPRPEER